MYQRDIFIDAIGRCRSCEIVTCTKPKARQLYPENGCADWTTPEAELTQESLTEWKDK